MIALSTKTLRIDGNFIFNDNNLGYNDIERRVSRVKTLDEGIYITDSGASVGDKNIFITINNPSLSLINILSGMAADHSEYVVVTVNGAYNATLNKLTIEADLAEIELFVESTA